MLAATLAHKPKTWSDISYSGVRFKTITLAENCEEYLAISNKFHNRRITKIERIQHPFAYGRFILKKDQLKLEGYDYITEDTVFHSIDVADKYVAIEYNCDPRRYSGRYKGTTPTFRSTPDSSANIIIVLQKLQQSNQESDADYYPTYIVELD
ncbi:uncharacterized protein LOC113387540 [Ctenocephalides felis]|uniref:uncharacterized protein LOC113387540 n=1 Tax=Ctenocephalides felis TaxID=7515 RepID=UPI000E6E1FA8|nr:uncharacterized protein LOC113387540 [Ctenocephalides felis]